MVTKKPAAKGKKAKSTDESKPGPGRPSQLDGIDPDRKPVRIELPESCVEFLTQKNKEGLSKSAYIQNLIRREMNREAIFKGKSDLELFAAFLESSIERSEVPISAKWLPDTIQKFTKYLKKMEQKIYK